MSVRHSVQQSSEAIQVDSFLEETMDEAASAPLMHEELRLLMERYDAVVQQHPAYENRPSQRQMVEAIARAYQENHSLLIEAGTGAGKSFGYLIPALLSPRNGPVVVSTGTIALQEQLLHKDVPFLQQAFKALGLPELRVALVKGRGNYLCIQKMQEQLRIQSASHSGTLSAAFRLHLEQLQVALEAGWDGDVGSLDMAPPKELWNELQSSTDECLGWRCQYYQQNPYKLSRDALAKADLIIANHALYFQDLTAGNQLLPDHQHLVVDEAHTLAGYATNAFTSRIGRYQATRLMASIQKHLSAIPDELSQLIQSCEASILHWLLDKAEGRSAFPIRVDEALTEVIEELRAGLAGLYNWVSELSFCSDEGEASSDKQQSRDKVKRLQRDKTLQRLEGLLEAWQWFLMEDGSFERQERLNWVELDQQHLYYELRSTPLAVNTLLYERLWSQKQAVLTSATLAVDNDLHYSRAQLGLPKASVCPGLILPSSFDYASQGLLYLPAAGVLSEDIYEESYLDTFSEHLVALLQATDGRAFVLFTSYKRMEAVARRLMGELDFPVRVQGELPRHRLLDWFKSTPNSVLLATATFWEGVDIPGEALSCVVIEKLPFNPPDDPVNQAQVERLKNTGQDWFNRYVLPQAILRVKQGVGRLLRTQQDRGVIALLDPRIQSKGYGRKVLNSLPRMRQTRDLQQVSAFLEAGSK